MSAGLKFFYLFLVGLPAMAVAQNELPDTVELPLAEVRSSFVNSRLDQVSGSVSLIPVVQNGAPVAVIASVLDQASGIQIQSGSINTNRITIRGVGSRSPYSTNRIRMYYGDFPLTDAGGESATEDLDPFDIRFIEVMKGPGSALYGQGLGGVIRMVPAWPLEDSLKVALRITAGSFGRSQASLRTEFGSGRWAFKLGSGRLREDGFRENSAYDRQNLTLLARYATKKTSLQMLLLRNDLRAQIPSSLNKEDYLYNPWSAAPNWLAVKGYEEYYKVLAGMSLTHHWSTLFYSKSVIYTQLYQATESRPFNYLDQQSLRSGFRQDFYRRLGPIELGMGLEGIHERNQAETFTTLGGIRGGYLDGSGNDRFLANTLISLSGNPHPFWHFEGGMNIHASRYFPRPILSPRIGFSYLGWKSFILRGAAGHGFSLPTLEEALLPDGTYNRELLPETGWNIDLGIRFNADPRIRMQLDVYSIWLNNLIATQRLAEDQFMGINAGRTHHLGLEAEGEIRIGHWRLTSQGYLGRFKFKEFLLNDQEFSGNSLPGLPNFRWHNRISREKKGFLIYLENEWVGKQYLTDQNEIRHPGFILWHVGLSYRHAFADQIMVLSGAVRNLFDTNYPAMILVNAPSFGSSLPRYYYPGQGRSWIISLAFDL